MQQEQPEQLVTHSCGSKIKQSKSLGSAGLPRGWASAGCCSFSTHSLTSDKHLPRADCMPCLAGRVGTRTRGIVEVGTGGVDCRCLVHVSFNELPPPPGQPCCVSTHSFIYLFIHAQTLTGRCVSSGRETLSCTRGTCIPVSYGGSVLPSEVGRRQERRGLSCQQRHAAALMDFIIL